MRSLCLLADVTLHVSSLDMIEAMICGTSNSRSQLKSGFLCRDSSHSAKDSATGRRSGGTQAEQIRGKMNRTHQDGAQKMKKSLQKKVLYAPEGRMNSIIMHICGSERICCLPELSVASNVTAGGPGLVCSQCTCHCSLVPLQRRPPAWPGWRKNATAPVQRDPRWSLGAGPSEAG